jgi:Rap1a immunity proteins
LYEAEASRQLAFGRTRDDRIGSSRDSPATARRGGFTSVSGRALRAVAPYAPAVTGGPLTAGHRKAPQRPPQAPDSRGIDWGWPVVLALTLVRATEVESLGACESRVALGVGQGAGHPSAGLGLGMGEVSVWTDQNGHRIMGSCPPAKTTLLQLIHSFVKYAGSHRRQLRGSNTAAAVMTAFQEAFPCNGAVTPPDDDDGIPYSPT